MGGNETIFMTKPNPTPMTPDQQRIAIAQACGWTDTQIIDGKYGQTDVPDYLGDLNAMHEAEKVLSGEQKEQFIFWLNHLHPSADIHYAEKKRELRLDVFDLVHTTASQRSEAFLHTLNLWQPTPTKLKTNDN